MQVTFVPFVGALNASAGAILAADKASATRWRVLDPNKRQYVWNFSMAPTTPASAAYQNTTQIEREEKIHFRGFRWWQTKHHLESLYRATL